MRPVHIAGVGMTRFGRREEDFLALTRAAADDLESRLGSPILPDHLVVASQDPGAFAEVGNAAAAIADTLARPGVAATRVEAAPASGLAALETAEALIRSGQRERVLVVGVEKMTGLSTDAANHVLARMADPTERHYGVTMAGAVALVTRAYLDTYGHSADLLDLAAAKAHRQGALNRYAQFQKEVPVETIHDSPMVADPLRRHHSAPISDGAACVLLTAAPGPVRLAATGHATDALALTHRRGPQATTHFAATRRAAEEAFARSGHRVANIDVAEVHDAFSALEAIALEDLGFYAPGLGLTAIADGATDPDGPTPTNCGGGIKARGHPVGATGLAMVAELFWQLTQDDEVHTRQAQGRDGDPRVGLAHNMGGLGNNVVVAILEATD